MYSAFLRTAYDKPIISILTMSKKWMTKRVKSAD
ncbi:hypothetical protein DT23_18095 [Thioclava indica]|uniref:Uncharacterized protein n=1 Tax=Thioclava indica TaxID=1353528 RepID=A0A074JB00_9RHOB|nr:hypothetical protein DT23_18095 [Thioclava indica]